MRVIAAALLLIGDLIVKKDGEVIDCVVISQDEKDVVYRIPTGTRQLPMDMIVRVERKTTLANRYEAAAFYIQPGDAVSYYALAWWCDENGLAAPVQSLYRMASFEERIAHLSYIARAAATADPADSRVYLELALSSQPDDPAAAKAFAELGRLEKGFGAGIYSILADTVEKFVARDYGGTVRKIRELNSTLRTAERRAVNRTMQTRLGFGIEELAERADAMSQQRAYLGGGKLRCPLCKGTRYVRCRTCGGKGWVTCPKCRGTGRTDRGTTCPVCQGVGRVNCKDCIQSKYGRSVTVTLPDGKTRTVILNATGKRPCPRCGKFMKGLPRDVIDKAIPLTVPESKRLKRSVAQLRRKAKGGFAYEWDAAKPLRQLQEPPPAERKTEPLVFVVGNWVRPRAKKLYLRASKAPPKEDAEWFEAYKLERLAADLSRAARKMSFDGEGLQAWEGFFARWLWTEGGYYERKKLFSAVFAAAEGRDGGYVSSAPDGAVFVVSERILLRPEPALELPKKFDEILLYFRITHVQKKLARKDGLPSLSWAARIEPVFATAHHKGARVWSY